MPARIPILNHDLRLEDIKSDDQWAILASTFNTYEYHGSNEKASEIANVRKHDTLTDLRTCLFFEWRRASHHTCLSDEHWSYIQSIMQKIREHVAHNEKHQDRLRIGLGSIVGGFVGDAAGATLEFLGRKPTGEEVDKAMRMVGGGCWNTAPGQITDDGEMTICLMKGLHGQDSFKRELIARAYLDWLNSPPFDMGITTRNGLAGGTGKEMGQIAIGMEKAAEKSNQESKANGALMRATPLGVWGHRLTIDELANAAMSEARLTHCNETCQHSSAVYAIAIRHLMLHPGDARGAYNAAKEWAGVNANEEVKEWLDLAENNVDVGYYPQAGFVKYGLVHAFRHLYLNSNYDQAIKETLMGGGDTDTNACIVGGLVGAAKGLASPHLDSSGSVPFGMAYTVITCDTNKGGEPRPDWLHTRYGMLEPLITSLIL
jgi:ADP-ribosylglycohydrolase